MLLKERTYATQSIEAVKQLIAYDHNGQEPKEMPPFYRMCGELILVLSNKKDGYYVVTPKACSCPSFIYRGGPCKHQRKYFAESRPRSRSMAETLKEHDRNLYKMPKSYQRMVRLAREEAEAEDDPDSLIKRGGFRPVYPGDEPSETDSKHDQEV
jgi:predicted nucleic acid-binding Zn finger protein